MSQVTHVTDESFKNEVLEADLPVLVDFWAEWCAPCRIIGPVVEDLAEDYEGKLKVVKLNTETSLKVPSELGIRGIPTLILFHNGEVVDQVVGAVPKTTLTEMLDKALSPN